MNKIVSVLFVALLAACGAGPDSSEPVAPAGITHGPMLGRIGSDRVAVWARTAEPGEFRVFYGLAPDQLTSSRAVATSLEHDNTGWAVIDGLQSNTKYYYSVGTGEEPAGDPERNGLFHTLPEKEDVANAEYNPDGLFNLRFEFACGNNQNPDSGSAFGPALPTFATLRKQLIEDKDPSRIDFAILNGDWLYEQDAARRQMPADWAQATNPPNGEIPKSLQLMPNLAGVWANYKTYLEKGKNMADFHRFMPYYFTFDDHEIVNDVYGSAEVGRQDRRAVFRDIGIQAWYDYLGWANDFEAERGGIVGRTKLQAGSDLLRDEAADFSALDLSDDMTLHVHWGTPDAGVMNGANDTEGGDPNARVYKIVERVDEHTLRIEPTPTADTDSVYSIGRRSYWNKRISNAELFFVDTRSYRRMHDVNNRHADVSMLGPVQKRWLKDGMKASDADFLFVVSSVNFSIPHVGGTGSAQGMPANKDDAWTVFLKEREEMINYWNGLGKPVFILTGDLHNSFAIQVDKNVWEFASGPHNSVNHPAQSEGDRPINGEYDSFGRKVDIRWSSYITNGTPNEHRNRPVYCIVRINNVFRNSRPEGSLWVAYKRPQAVFQYYDGVTGELLYAESILAR